MSRRYAEDTKVSVERSRNQIELLLKRHGCTAFGFVSEGYNAMIRFNMPDPDVPAGALAIQMHIPLPTPDDDEVRYTPTGMDRSAESQRTMFERLCRARWRAVFLVVKAKLEAIDAGISTLEREFMPDVLLPSGRTIGDEVRDQKQHLHTAGSIKLLPGSSS